MKNDKDPEDMKTSGRGRSRADRGQGKMKAAVIAVLIIIVLAAVFAISSSNAKKKQAEAESLAAESLAAEEAAKAAATPETSEFAECNIPELNILAEEYFDAKLAGDINKLAEIFGKDVSDMDQDLATRLKGQADWIQSYTLDKVYVANGLDDNSKLCLVFYTIDFRRTDTMAPGVMYFYAIRNSEGVYTIAENPVKEIHDYINSELATDTAKSLIDDSNARLKEALDSDSTLALIYESFRSGEIYKESNLDVNRDQEVGFTAEDSVLVDDSVLADIENEAAEEASIEASLAAEDESSAASEEASDTASESAETESSAEN